MQIRRFGNAKTGGLFTFFSPGRWMTISDGNGCWFSEPHELHAIGFTSRKFVVNCEPRTPEYPSLPPRIDESRWQRKPRALLLPGVRWKASKTPARGEVFFLDTLFRN